MLHTFGITIYKCGMNTPFTYVLKIQMFGYSQIIACSVIIGTACITGHQFPTAMIGMRGGIVQTKDYLRSPLLPPLETLPFLS